jgi:hypothetical protein
MDIASILAPGSPLIQIHEANELEVYRQMWQVEQLVSGPKVVARAVRGWKCPTGADFFTEVGAAWQFPHSLPEDWEGFADDLSRLGWWPADAYLFVVTRAVKFLEDEPASALKQFQDAMQHAYDRFARSNRWRGPKGFRAILQATAETSPLLRTRLKSARLNIDAPAVIRKKR